MLYIASDNYLKEVVSIDLITEAKTQRHKQFLQEAITFAEYIVNNKATLGETAEKYDCNKQLISKRIKYLGDNATSEEHKKLFKDAKLILLNNITKRRATT